MLSQELSQVRADYAIRKASALYRVKTLPSAVCVYRKGPAALWQKVAEIIVRLDATGLQPLLEDLYEAEAASRILYELTRAYQALAALREASPIVSVNKALAVLRAAEASIKALKLPWAVSTEYMVLYRLQGDIVSRFLRIFADTPYGQVAATLEFTTNTIE